MESTPLRYEPEARAAPSSCWGAQFQLSCGAECMPDFIPGKRHFKSKFCDGCRDSILVPLTRVRALSAELAACFVNKRSEGFWNRAPKNMGGGQYRIINNTAGSVGPRLALFRDQPPAFNWPSVPEHWVTDDGQVRLCVAKGTLVPSKTLRCGHPQASAKRCLSSGEEVISRPLQQRSTLKRGLVPNAPFQPFPKRGCPARPPSSSTLASFYSTEQQLPPLQAQPCANPCALAGLEEFVAGLPEPSLDGKTAPSSPPAVVQALPKWDSAPLPVARCGAGPFGRTSLGRSSGLAAASSAATAAARAAAAAAAAGGKDTLPNSISKATSFTSASSPTVCQTATLTLQQLKRSYKGGGGDRGNHSSLAPLEDLDDNLDLDGESKGLGDLGDETEAKRQKRMRRNRESAATSRERKKAYIEHLEGKLAELSHIANMLRTENDALRAGHGRVPSEGSAPVPMPSDPTSPFVPPAELASLFAMPGLLSSDNDSESPNDSESNDGTDQAPDTNHEKLEIYSPFEVFKLFSQEPMTPMTHDLV